MSAVDLHCHVLPAVDDGPRTLEESVDYARRAAERGTRTVVATPHVELVEVAELPDRVHELRAVLAATGVDLRVEVGGELKPESLGALGASELETIAHGPPGARWLLYEVPFDGVDDDFLAGARELRERGYGLVLAHPERSRDLLPGGLAALEPELQAARVALLSNVGPLIGAEGEARRRALAHLLDRGLVHALVTDAHPPRRPYTLDLARAALAELGRDGDVAEALVAGHAARLLGEGLAGAP